MAWVLAKAGEAVLRGVVGEGIKDAYKALIKQSHPDRVQGMSPIFRKLAEAETKKLNAAYRHALLAVPFAAEREAAA